MAPASSPYSRTLAALSEILAVVALALAVYYVLGRDAAVQAALAAFDPGAPFLVGLLLPLVLIGFAADILLRWRGPRSWGLRLPASPAATGKLSLYLLAMGGIVPLILTALESEGETPSLSLHGHVLSVLGPILALDLFVLGYVQRRLQDVIPSLSTILPLGAIFVLADITHLDGEASGVVFAAAAAWQGIVWAATRLAYGSIVPQLIAHAGLVVLLAFPIPGAVGLLVVGFFIMTPAAHWVRRVLNVLRRTRGVPGGEAPRV